MQAIEYEIVLKQYVNEKIDTKQTPLQEMTQDQLRALIDAANREIEKQERFSIADDEEAMKLFFEEIEPQYSGLFARLAKL